MLEGDDVQRLNAILDGNPQPVINKFDKYEAYEPGTNQRL